MFKLRKTVISIDKTYHDGGQVTDNPCLRGGICSVVSNPYAGKYVENLEQDMDILKPLGQKMAKELLDAMGCKAKDIESYGKGALVGAHGEQEHGALWHVPGGYAMRQLLGDTKAIVPSTKKVAAMGSTLDIPLSHINATYVRGHFSTYTLQVPDAPKDDELVFCLVMSTGPRIHNRMGGLAANEIQGKDGLR